MTVLAEERRASQFYFSENQESKESLIKVFLVLRSSVIGLFTKSAVLTTEKFFQINHVSRLISDNISLYIIDRDERTFFGFCVWYKPKEIHFSAGESGGYQPPLP